MAKASTNDAVSFFYECSSVASSKSETMNEEKFPTSAHQPTPDEIEEARLYAKHVALLIRDDDEQQHQEATTTPIFTPPVLKHIEKQSPAKTEKPFPQYGLLAGLVSDSRSESAVEEKSQAVAEDSRVFFNIASPFSTFICGSQGTGKSHTLSCLLENALVASDASKLPHPLAGLVFHYDTFISDHGGLPCEAAFLASNPMIKVRVLCAPTNLATIKKAYSGLNVTIEPLRINETDLNTKRMLDLMAVAQDDGPMPLYLHTIYRILRNMRMVQQVSGGSFDYNEFKSKVMNTALAPAQLVPLNQRLDTLESFMPEAQTSITWRERSKKKSNLSSSKGNDWTPKAGCLTIVDLSCPCVTPEGACSLFNICLSIFLEGSPSIGRVVALDEAHKVTRKTPYIVHADRFHKYMNASAEASTLTSTLLSTIRLQRHLGCRVMISTQEPTISPALLDLSTVTIVHRFTSPEWLSSLKDHLAGVASNLIEVQDASDTGEKSKHKLNVAKKVFNEIVNLKNGEALLFSPSAITGLEVDKVGSAKRLVRLGAGHLKIRVRSRLTTDGGKSVMAA